MSLPKVSVLIINHNYGHWITDAINSAVIQDYPNKQLMIVDDGSSDDSINIITKLCNIQNYKVGTQAEGCIGKIKAKLYSHPKALGPSAARNSGIKLAWADTDIYSMLDSDDIYKQGRVSKCVTKLIDGDFVGCVYSDYDVINTNTGIYRREYKEPFSLQRLLQECIVHSATTIKKKVLEDVGVYDINLRVCEDYDLWIRIGQKYMISHIPESLMIVRDHQTNSTNSVNKDIWNKAWQYISNKYKYK